MRFNYVLCFPYVSNVKWRRFSLRCYEIHRNMIRIKSTSFWFEWNKFALIYRIWEEPLIRLKYSVQCGMWSLFNFQQKCVWNDFFWSRTKDFCINSRATCRMHYVSVINFWLSMFTEHCFVPLLILTIHSYYEKCKINSTNSPIGFIWKLKFFIVILSHIQ